MTEKVPVAEIGPRVRATLFVIEVVPVEDIEARVLLTAFLTERLPVDAIETVCWYSVFDGV